MEFMKEHKSVFNDGTDIDILSFQIKKLNSAAYQQLDWQGKQAVIHWMEECITRLRAFQKEIVDNNIPF